MIGITSDRGSCVVDPGHLLIGQGPGRLLGYETCQCRESFGRVRLPRQHIEPSGEAPLDARDLIPLAADGSLGPVSGLIAAAHRAGLKVGTYTFRPENRFLPADMRSTAGEGARNPAGSVAEIRRYIAAGVDAFFTDDPALGRIAVDGEAVPAG